MLKTKFLLAGVRGGGGVVGKTYVEKRFVSFTNFIVAARIRQFSAGLISGKPYKYIFSSLAGKLVG